MAFADFFTRPAALTGATKGVYLGRFYDDDTGQWLKTPLVYAGDRHGLLFGPTGTGKTVRWLMSNLLGDYLNHTSIVVTDPKGELSAVCAKARHEAGHFVKILDPFNKLRDLTRAQPQTYQYLIRHDLIESQGFEPLSTLDPKSPSFYDDAAAIAEAMISVDSKDPHWSESAQGLLTGLCMLERVRMGAKASLAHVRIMLTEPETRRTMKDSKGNEAEVPVTGLRAHVADAIRLQAEAEAIIKEKGTGGEVPFSLDIITSLLARFLEPTREIQSIVSTLDTQSRWLLSTPIRRNLAQRPAIRFADLKEHPERPTTLFIIMPAERVRTYAAWIRLMVVCCLRSLYTPGGRRVVFLLDEMPALGPLAALSDAYAIVRGFNIQIFGIAQDLVQLKDLYKDRYESFLANAGVIQYFTPNDLTTAGWISQRAGLETVLAKGISTNKNPRDTEAEGTSFSQKAKPLYSVQELTGLLTGTGILFMSGLANGVRFYTPEYWQIDQTKNRALPNPYYM